MEVKSINDIVNESSIKNYNVNDNVRESERVRRADRIATSICRKLGNSGDPVAYKLYCKAAYNLSESQIWTSVEIATEHGRNPARYLSWLLSRELRRN